MAPIHNLWRCLVYSVHVMEDEGLEKLFENEMLFLKEDKEEKETSTCECQDCSGHVCGKEMTKEEEEQDGMCWNCADNVYNEMTSVGEYKWFHEKEHTTCK